MDLRFGLVPFKGMVFRVQKSSQGEKLVAVHSLDFAREVKPHFPVFQESVRKGTLRTTPTWNLEPLMYLDPPMSVPKKEMRTAA